MRKLIPPAILCCLIAVVGVALASDAQAPMHTTVTPGDLKWGPPPPVFEQTATFAVVSGNPMGEGLYVVRLKMPAGYKIMPHWHPTEENVTVLSGDFKIAMGEKFDEKAMTDLPTGGFLHLPAEMRHYAMAKTDCIVQVHGPGPFKLIYVNPDDDPSKKMSKN